MKKTSIEVDNIKVEISIDEPVEGQTWHKPLIIAVDALLAHGYNSTYLENLKDELYDLKERN